MAKRRSPDEVRRALVDAGARLFAARGLSATNSNEIARAAGVGVGSFYRHFRDKRELLDALRHDLTHALRDRTQRAAGAARGLEAQVRALVEAAVGLAEERPEGFRVVAGDSGRRTSVRLSRRPVEKRLSELRTEGRLHVGMDPSVAAKAFEVMQAGVLAWWLEDPERASRESVVETLVRLHPALAGKLDASAPDPSEP